MFGPGPEDRLHLLLAHAVLVLDLEVVHHADEGGQVLDLERGQDGPVHVVVEVPLVVAELPGVALVVDQLVHPLAHERLELPVQVKGDVNLLDLSPVHEAAFVLSGDILVCIGC